MDIYIFHVVIHLCVKNVATVAHIAMSTECVHTKIQLFGSNMLVPSIGVTLEGHSRANYLSSRLIINNVLCETITPNVGVL
jgi:hypothetical protein